MNDEVERLGSSARSNLKIFNVKAQPHPLAHFLSTNGPPRIRATTRHNLRVKKPLRATIRGRLDFRTVRSFDTTPPATAGAENVLPSIEVSDSEQLNSPAFDISNVSEHTASFPGGPQTSMTQVASGSSGWSTPRALEDEEVPHNSTSSDTENYSSTPQNDLPGDLFVEYPDEQLDPVATAILFPLMFDNMPPPPRPARHSALSLFHIIDHSTR
ncbi:hypothetical protein ACJ73_09589 [Blastomyces percursus]|uniref:Uncharacterized protein n=1 Tax=Blastomyces percursus TaxID=1658174 RepID=A0A1J9P4Y5_9EURO|nr:hypothetical protein ACJ73_09589 [Blastomyces percursus]